MATDDLSGLAARDAVRQLSAPSPGGEPVTPHLLRYIAANSAPALAPALVESVKARDAFGRAKYGQPLFTGDGRATDVEVWQELVDALQYAEKAVLEGQHVDTPLVMESLRLLKLLLRFEPVDVIARRAYQAYNETGPNETHWRTFDGRPVPAWDDLPPAVREKWMAAVGAV